MPLKKGPNSISYNMSKLMKEWEDTGMIGNQKPKTRKEALRMALSISFQLAKKPKKEE